MIGESTVIAQQLEWFVVGHRGRVSTLDPRRRTTRFDMSEVHRLLPVLVTDASEFMRHSLHRP